MRLYMLAALLFVSQCPTKQVVRAAYHRGDTVRMELMATDNPTLATVMFKEVHSDAAIWLTGYSTRCDKPVVVSGVIPADAALGEYHLCYVHLAENNGTVWDFHANELPKHTIYVTR